MFSLKYILIVLIALSLAVTVSATQGRFIVLTAAQDPEERRGGYFCKDYIGMPVNEIHDSSFNFEFQDIDLEQKPKFFCLIDDKVSTRYNIDLIDNKLSVLIASLAKKDWCGRKLKYKDLIEPDDEAYDYISETRRRNYDAVFKIGSSKKTHFSYPFEFRTLLIQRGFLEAPNEIINAFDVLSKETFQEELSVALLLIPPQSLTTSILGIYDKQTGRVFIYDFELGDTYILFPLGITNKLPGWTDYGYVSIPIYGIPEFSCWCNLHPNTDEPSVQQKAEQVIINFFSSFSLKKNVLHEIPLKE